MELSGRFGCSLVTLVLSIPSKEATDVRDTAVIVKEALEQAEKAQNAATEAIKQATNDIKGTQDLKIGRASCRERV